MELAMYRTVKRLYLEGRLNEQSLDKAIEDDWIDSAQKEEIIGSKLEVA